MKRIFSMLVAITMLMCAVGFVPISAHAAIIDSGECGADGGNLTWTLDDEGTLTISGTGDMADYTIITSDPPSYSTAPWYIEAMRIGEDLDKIKRVIIEDGVTSIGKCAFALCYGLTSASIPSSVTTIRSDAFYQCNSLTDVNIPNGVTTIGSHAFSYCTELTDIDIPESVTSVVPTSFYACYKLTGIDINENNKNYSSENGVVFNKDKTTLIQYPAGKEDTQYSIPDSVTSIDSAAFACGRNLMYVTIPDSVTSIGDGAFIFNIALKSITIPGSITTISQNVFCYCTALTDVVICDGVETIGRTAFSDCRSLTKVTIPDSVTTIGSSAFECCFALESVTIPDRVTSLGNYAFYMCESLKSAVIGKGVTSLGWGTFQRCGNLTSVTIPVSVTSIDKYVFYKCDNLTDVYYGGTEEDWNNVDINEYANECLFNAEIHYNSLPQKKVVTVEPPTVNLESGEVPYGSKVTISPTNGNDFEYSVNGEQFINSRLMNGLGNAVLTITEDTVLVVRSMIDVVEPDTEYIFPEATYTYTIGGCVVPAIYPYTINSLKLVSENGEEYDTPPTDKSFIVDVDITKNSERDSKDYFIVAAYDANGALISMNYIKANLPAGSNFSCGVNMPKTDKTIGSIKAFVWDALGGMTPLAEGKSIECSAPSLME